MTSWGPSRPEGPQPPGPPGQPWGQPQWGQPQPQWGQPQPQWGQPAWGMPPPKRRNPAAIVIPIVLVLALVGLGVAIWLLALDDAVEWDPEIKVLADFVESERGLKFEKAVAVEYLSEEEWDADAGDTSGLTDDDIEDLDDSLVFLRAIGLAEGDPDLVDQLGDFTSDAYVGYYSPVDKRIRVRGEFAGELPVELKATLVHELTHALQDQHFDLDNIWGDPEADNAFAVQALIEGDASNVENGYVADLSSADFDALSESYEAYEGETSNFDIPVGIEVSSFAPYALGPGFAQAIDSVGAGELNHAFRLTPGSDEHVFDPLSYINGDEPRDVETPEISESADEVDSGTFGALGFFIMLSERIDPHQAMRATDGWGGDAYVQYREGDTNCVRIRYFGDTETDLTEMHDALTAWIGSLPTPFAKVVREGDYLDFESCDPGPDVLLRTGKAIDAIALPLVRSEIMGVVADEGASAEEADCFANRVVEDSTFEELADSDHAKWSSPEWDTRSTVLAGECFAESDAI